MIRDAEFQIGRTVPLGALRRYLTLNNWHGPEEVGHGLDLYKFIQDGATLEILLPRAASDDSHLRWIADALRTLSQFQNTELPHIASIVRSVGVDTLKSTVPDALVRFESIHLDVAAGFLKYVKQLLAAAATTEIAPEPFFFRVRKEAKNYADDCRFGHTFRGSFGFTIESPVTPNPSPTIEVIEQIPPFERRVMQRLARGLRSAQAAVSEQDTSAIVENYKIGLSANMCEELVDLAESIKGERLGFEFAFSPEWRMSPDIRSDRHFVIAAQHIELIKDAARHLRLQEFERNVVVAGRIVRLKSDNDPSDLLHPLGSREVTIQWNSEDFGEINVRVLLTPQQYLAACEAHKAGREIAISGFIERVGKIWRLLEPSDFNIPA